MRRKREIGVPKMASTFGLCSAEEVRYYISRHPVYAGMTDKQLGEKLGLSAGFVGMVLKGTREPSKAFLDAIGWEAVPMYRMKSVASRLTSAVLE